MSILRAILSLALLTSWVSPAFCEDLDPVARCKKYLIFDTLILSETRNVQLELGKVRKHPPNPLMVEDRPWELRYDNLYANVAYDAQSKRYMCWYNPFAKWGAVEAVKRGEVKKADFLAVHESKKYPGWETVVALSVSTDGLRWEKPNFDLYDYKGSTESNIIAPINSPGIHGAGVFLNEHSVAGQPGSVVINPVACLGTQLTITAEAQEGSIRVTVLSQDGKELMTSEPITGDVHDHPVVFLDKKSLTDQLGKPLAIKFELDRAKTVLLRLPAIARQSVAVQEMLDANRGRRPRLRRSERRHRLGVGRENSAPESPDTTRYAHHR